jgi:hypothetical protein
VIGLDGSAIDAEKALTFFQWHRAPRPLGYRRAAATTPLVLITELLKLGGVAEGVDQDKT